MDKFTVPIMCRILWRTIIDSRDKEEAKNCYHQEQIIQIGFARKLTMYFDVIFCYEMKDYSISTYPTNSSGIGYMR
jgi:hypothetical protein